jgi:hypothetical protein
MQLRQTATQRHNTVFNDVISTEMACRVQSDDSTITYVQMKEWEGGRFFEVGFPRVENYTRLRLVESASLYDSNYRSEGMMWEMILISNTFIHSPRTKLF